MTPDTTDECLCISVIHIKSDSRMDRFAAQIGDHTEECTESKHCAVKRAIDTYLGREKSRYCEHGEDYVYKGRLVEILQQVRERHYEGWTVRETYGDMRMRIKSLIGPLWEPDGDTGE